MVEGFRKGRADIAGQQLYVYTPFLTNVLGFIIADEVPEPSTIVGGGIILSGVFLFNFGGKLYGALCNKKNTI